MKKIFSLKKILKKKIFIIAEIGINHNGSFKKCKKLIKLAANCGADAVKIQTINPDESYHTSSKSYDIFKNKDFTLKELIELKKFATKEKIVFFSTPGDISSLKKIIKANFNLVKVSSGLLTNIPLINEIAKCKKPIIISTGMSKELDIDYTVSKLKKNEFYILKCTSIYPANDIDLNLNSINYLSKKYNVICGFSDHTQDALASIAAASKGARIIEKHFKMSKFDKCPDEKISMDPENFKKMCYQIRRVEKMLGNKNFQSTKKELKLREKNYRYIFSAKDLYPGDTLNLKNINFKRSNLKQKKIEPKNFNLILKKKVKKFIKSDTPIMMRSLHVK